MSGAHSCSKISLLSERCDIIKFVENACEPAVSMSVIRTFDDFGAAVTGDSLVILDADYLSGCGESFLNLDGMICNKIICILPIDVPRYISVYVEHHFRYMVPFPISIEKFRLMILRFQNLINNKQL